MKPTTAARRAVALAAAASLALASPAVASVSVATLLVNTGAQSVEQQTLAATEPDASVVAVSSGASAVLSQLTLEKDGDATDPAALGQNAALVADGTGTVVYGSDLAATTTGGWSDGLFASGSGALFVNGASASTLGPGSAPVAAAGGGVLLADASTLLTQGEAAPCVAVADGGNVSLVTSTLSASGADAPAVSTAGELELDRVRGMAADGPIATVSGGRLLLNNSTLESMRAQGDAGVVVSGGASVVQAANSTLGTQATEGALFDVRDAEANVVLSHATLTFSANDVLLARVGAGGRLNLTTMNQDLAGDIEAEGEVSVLLRKGSTWAGTVTGDATVNVCPTSTWVVTADTTIANLNVKDGGKVVDADGKAVPVVAGGTTVVEGDAPVSVTLTGAYGTTYETRPADELADDLLGRGAFDNRFGTETVFRMGFDSSGVDWSECHCGTGDPSEGEQDAGGQDVPWWEAVWNAITGFFAGLFGQGA